MSCDAGSGQVQSLARVGWLGNCKRLFAGKLWVVRSGPRAIIHTQLLWGRPTASHDHRFEAENACSRSDLFHLTMTWKRLGLNSYKTDLC
jgi:hypothetical protein